MDNVDFLSELPIEVVELVLSFVDVADTLTCLRVSKRWNSLLTSSRLDRYWKKVCQSELGLTKARLLGYQMYFSLVKVASSVLRHQRWVRGFMSKIDKLDKGKYSVDCRVRTSELFQFPRLIMNRYPQDNLTHPSCFIGHNFILCSPLFLREPHLTIATVSTMTKSISASSRDPLRTCLERPRHSWVFWAKSSFNYVLILIQPEGRWIGYCPLSGKIILDVVSDQARVLLAGGCAAITSCERCFLLVTLKAVYSEAATWDLNVLKMGRPPDDVGVSRSCDTVCTKSIVVKLKAKETVINWKFLSLDRSEERAESGHYCSSHQLVCITNFKIHIYTCTLTCTTNKQTPSKETDLVTVKAGEIVIPVSPQHKLDPDTGLIQLTSIRCSLDCCLLGVVVNPSLLYVWDIHTYELISSVNLLNLAQPTVHSCRLLAVGHLHTVVAMFDEKPGGQICIIGTTSGRVLSRRESWVQWRVHEGKDYIHLVNEEWLSDIFCFNAPFFTYLNASPSMGSSTQNLSCVQFLHHSKVKCVS